MKKFLALILAGMLALSLVACEDTYEKGKQDTGDTDVVSPVD